MMDNRFAALPENEIARPTPAVVIAVGRFAAQAARQVQRIYLRGDKRRKAASAFYRLVSDGAAGLDLVELADENEGEPESESGSYLEQRRGALRCAVEHGSTLRARLGRLLHEQRVHEHLIAAGWAEIYDVPLNFFILGDLNDPWAAGILLPLGAILNELLSNANLCQAHWLLSTAVFPDGEPDRDLAIWSFLQIFDDLLRPESEQRETLAKALKLQYRQAPDFALYLFDSRKEGTALVKDPASLKTLLSNALLALLQNDLARRFFQERDVDAIFERGSNYSGIGAAGLVYDPDSLQAACARRIGYAFLTEKILCNAFDGQAAIQLAHQLQEKMGGIYTWLESLSVQLPPAVGQVRIQPDTLEMAALLTNITLSPLDYERLSQTTWAEQLLGFQTRFEQETMPEVVAKLETNGQETETRLAEILRSGLDRLPLEAELYPGGLDNARQVLELTTAYFEKVTKDLETLTGKIQESRTAVADKFITQREQMQKLLANAPKLPWWARMLPAFARKWLAPLYLAWRYGRQLYRIQSLRDECLTFIQQLSGLQIEQQASDLIKNMLPHLQTQVNEAVVALTSLKEKMTRATQSFSADWDQFPLAAENGWDELFRQPVADHCLATWAYDKRHPDLDAWIHEFVAAQPLFADWRATELDAIIAWVYEQAAQAYQPVWSLDLEAIFGLWASHTPGFVSPNPPSGHTITSCMGAAIPPIRPDFDAVGGAGGSSATFHGLTGSPDWKLCCLPPNRESTVHWQAVYTGDPYTALFIQIRHNVPLRSLADSFQSAQHKLSSLPPDKRLAYNLFMELDQDIPPIVEMVDPNSPDLVHKTFQWKFKPKGSNKEFDQTIELAISRSRFEYYRRQPRYNGQWNLYAELDMPEINDLASEFQKLHARRKWNTFNQAYNVLKFVQNCIPYAYDKDTTGHEDWARYPIETLMECTGDCEDVAILCAAVITRLGFQTVLLLYLEHLAFGVAVADNLKGDYVIDQKTGLQYYYGEATAKGWYLGEIPKDYLNTKPKQILPITRKIQEE